MDKANEVIAHMKGIMLCSEAVYGVLEHYKDTEWVIYRNDKTGFWMKTGDGDNITRIGVHINIEEDNSYVTVNLNGMEEFQKIADPTPDTVIGVINKFTRMYMPS